MIPPPPKKKDSAAQDPLLQTHCHGPSLLEGAEQENSSCGPAVSRLPFACSNPSKATIEPVTIRQIFPKQFKSKKPLTRVSKPVPGVHGKRGLERGRQRRLAKGWRNVGEGLAKGWRVSLHPPIRNSGGTHLEDLVCDSMVNGEPPNPYNLSEKYWRYTSNLYRSTPICNAVPRWLLRLRFGDRETPQYTSNLYCSTPPICTAVRLPFVPQYASHLYRSTPPICTGDTFEKCQGLGFRTVPEISAVLVLCVI